MRKKFAILTSGGDAPGMNAAIRSLVRVAASLGHETLGVLRGYQGLLAGDFRPLGPRDVSHILEKGGTILRTARSPEFRSEAGLRKAAAALESQGIDTLFAIGGDGTLRGCAELGRHWHGQILGLPGTIDNDLWGTDFTIGFDTAVNTALNAIEKIRDTADSHERFFLVEVMGRHAGFIALEVAITCGAEDFLVPEMPFDLPSLHEKLQAGRLLATRLGAYAVEAAVAGEQGKMIGESAGRPVVVPLSQSFSQKKPLDPWTVRMAPCFSVAGLP